MPPWEKYHNNATPKKKFLTKIYPLLSDLDPVTLKLTLKIFLIKELFEVQKRSQKGQNWNTHPNDPKCAQNLTMT